MPNLNTLRLIVYSAIYTTKEQPLCWRGPSRLAARPRSRSIGQSELKLTAFGWTTVSTYPSPRSR